MCRIHVGKLKASIIVGSDAYDAMAARVAVLECTIQKQDGLQPNTECFLVLLKTELTERQRKANNLDVLKKFNDLLGEVFAQ